MGNGGHVQGIAAIAEAWLTQRRDGAIARVVAAEGLGPRRSADLLLVDGDPIANIELIADPAKNLVVIMKDGKLFKSIIPERSGT